MLRRLRFEALKRSHQHASSTLCLARPTGHAHSVQRPRNSTAVRPVPTPISLCRLLSTLSPTSTSSHKLSWRTVLVWKIVGSLFNLGSQPSDADLAISHFGRSQRPSMDIWKEGTVMRCLLSTIWSICILGARTLRQRFPILLNAHRSLASLCIPPLISASFTLHHGQRNILHFDT